ncbi:restriction endonuclease subunit S [Staphylococcus aureus]|uniref:restriction endonuclease subunit S n=1 Tax=Staphylococcus aureus TaxID=1280 RepID=UPI000B9528CB|nr:restriction endonuclease subunit S [Staphylococcus aureus]
MKPELRFLEFEEKWSYKKLKDLLKVHSGRDYKHLEPGEIPVYGTGGYMLSVSDYLSNDDAIGIGRKGTINKPYLLKAPFWTVDTLFYCTPREEVDLYFLLSLFKKINWKKYDESTGVPSLSKVNIEKIKVYSCGLEEQRKIGDFFRKLDRQIELEEQKLEKLEEQKKGYMQKVFSQELRFKDENGNEYPEWEDKKLLNVIAIQNGYAFKSNLFSERGMPIIRITDINKSTVKKGTVYYPESIEINERFKIKQYDILIAMSGATTGKVGKYISEKPSLLNQRIGKFVMKKGTDNNFMFTYLNSLYFKKELSKLLVAGAQPNISSQDIENINLFIPINEEQRKIGEFFNELDELIEKQSSKIGVLKQRKKGFLQKMFV